MTKTEELRRMADSLGSICEAIQYGSNGLFGVETIGPIKQAAAALREYAESLEREPVASGKWEGAEYWMPLAWELCAEEGGEESCNELLWCGGPIKEPWGDRWLQYEDEAKRLIALVSKHAPTHPPRSEPVDNHASDCATHNSPAYPNGPCDCQPTQAMCRAAVEYINGAGVYSKVPSEALEIEEGIYAEVWKAMQAAAPHPEPAIKQRLTTEPPKMTEAEIESLAHRKAWRYKYSSDPAHSHTYTFNGHTLQDFAAAICELRDKQWRGEV